jgi:membrane protein implicated in regulation of membrane protease activity
MWALGSLVALVSEACLGGSFIFVFFGFGAAMTAVLVGVGALTAVWQAVLCFGVLAALSLLLLRRPLRAWGQSRVSEREIDGLKGSTASVEQAMLPGHAGQVLHRGTIWMARNGGKITLAPGDSCKIIAADNLTLIVKADPKEF